MTREEAIDKVYGMSGTKEQHEALEFLIPEVRELREFYERQSEDERIRKALIEGVRQIRCKNGITQEQMIAYLEKQKENPKSADSIQSDCTSDAKYEDRWHKVGDSLPDNGREVLAKDKLGNTLLARYDGEGWDVSVYDDEDYRCHNGISKWCEIPSEKQKKQDKCPEFCVRSHCIGCSIYEKRKEQKPWKVGENAYFTPGQKPADLSEMMVHKEPYIAPVPTPMVADEQKPDTRDADDLQLLGFIYDLLNEIEWKDNWAMSKYECLRRLNNYSPQKPVPFSCGHENDKSSELNEKFVGRLMDCMCAAQQYRPGTISWDVVKGWAEELNELKKPAECIEDSVKFEEGFKAGRELGLRDGQKYVLNNLDSYGLCKPTEWSEEDRNTINAAATIVEGKGLKDLANRLRSLRPQPKQEWSEEDEKHLIWLCRIIHSRVVNKELSLAEESDLGKWIDKWINHEPQPVQKWGEFDEDCLKRAIWYVENPAPSVVKDTNLALWLKSLPGRFNLQLKQEWSEEDKHSV